MYKKLLIVLMSISSVSVFAISNNLFQEFDNQVSIGYGKNQTTSGFGINPSIPPKSKVITQTNIVNLEAERLFDQGIWVNLNAHMAFGAGPVGFDSDANMVLKPYVNPSDYGINAKVGYAFPMARQHLQVTPYGLVGLNNNFSLGLPGISNPQVANAYSYRGGVGARLEYRINRTVLLFADQLAAYNWDQSGPLGGVMPQNNVLFTSTLGAKFNVVRNFQIGVRGFYDNYQPQASNSIPGSAPMPEGFFAQPQNTYGGLISLGLTY